MKRFERLAAAAGAATLLLAGSSLAQVLSQPDETLPGFKSQQVYEVNSVDDVNLYSGDLHITVPLGPEYPLSPGLTWRLEAHYSSKLWHMFQYDEGVESPGCPGMNYFGTRAHLSGYSTLGAGWSLELGYVRPGKGASPTIWVSPDGARHTFLNLDADADFRLEPQADGTYVVRKADGTVLNFQHLYEIPAPANGFDFSDEDRGGTPELDASRQTLRYGLSSIVDRFNRTVLSVDYAQACSVLPCPANAWKVNAVQLSDPARTITFNWGTYSGGLAAFAILNSISFPVVGGNSLTATFAFKPDGSFYRTPFDSGNPPTGVAKVTAGPSSSTLPFLQSITQSDQTYSFEYFTGAASNLAGVLTSMSLPTGGRVDYGYETSTASFPRRCGCAGCDPCRPEEDPGTPCLIRNAPSTDLSLPADRCSDLGYKLRFTDFSPAVSSRTEKDLLGGAPDSVTKYERVQFGQSGTSDGPVDADRVVRRVIVKRPDGNLGIVATKYVFAASPNGGAGVELSRRYYPGCDTSATPLRSVVKCYPSAPSINHPALQVCGVMGTQTAIDSFSDITSLRPNRQVTWFGANPRISTPDSCGPSNSTPCWQDAFTGFDTRASEYATVTRSTNNDKLMSRADATRSTTTNWTPSPGSVWLPKLYSSRTVTDSPCETPPCSVTTTTNFDSTTGALLSTTIGGGGLSKTTTFAYTNSNPTTETISGTGLAGSYVTQRTFDFPNGLVRSSQRTVPAGLGWNQFQVTRDPTLGLVTASYDPNGPPTTYSWDTLSRLRGIQPPDEHPTTICYGAPSGGTVGAWALVRKGASTSCSTGAASPSEGSEKVEAYVYDGFGRLSREIRLLPNVPAAGYGGTFLAVRTTERNDAGLVAAVSEWEPCGSGSDLSTCYTARTSRKTTYSNFDLFGRPRQIVSPDGSQVRKTYDDEGIPSSDTREDTWTDFVTGVSIHRGTRKDILGRLRIASEAKEATDPAPYGPLAFYSWDVFDQLARVEQIRRDVTGASHTQLRLFTRNGLGFLTSESHPEFGPGASPTTYESFTALGHPQSTTTGGITLSTVYDALDRVVSVSSDGQTYLENAWDGANQTGGGWTKGQLTRRRGYNPAASENALVEESFTYYGLGGRLSKKTTNLRRGTFGSPLLQSVEQNLTWNAMGLLETRTLPAPAGAPAVTTESRYKAGYPTRILSGGVDLVTAATYHPYGGVAKYTTGNGVETTYDADPNLMPRPFRISSSGATQSFDSGTFAYDGAGNVLSMTLANGSADAFTYDRLWRLKTATWGTRSPAVTEAFTYDGGLDVTWPNAGYTEKGFGSLVRRTLAGDPNAGQVDLDTSLDTNRLSAAAYDTRGNLTTWGPDAFFYDALSRRVRHQYNGAVKERYLYSGDGERVAKLVSTSSLSPADPGPLRFYTLTPCRLFDSRDISAPSLQGQQSRNVTAAGRCGVPSNAVSLSLNITTAPKGASPGFIGLYPGGLTYRPVTTAAVVTPGKNRAAFSLGTLSSTAVFSLFADIPAAQQVDVIVDVSGYFKPVTPIPTTGTSWLLTYRDEANRPSAEYRFDEARPGLVTLERSHVYLGSLRVATREERMRNEAAPGWDYYVSDHLGTPRLRTATKLPGQSLAPVLETYRYGAFGLRLSGTPMREGQEFALMERDPLTGHHYDHARYYFDWPARFLTPDQVNGTPEDPQSWNRYAYARNNPLRFVDPDGRAAKIPESVTANYDRNFSFRASVYSTLLAAGPAGEGAALAADSVLKLAFPSSNGEVIENFNTALMGMVAGVDLPTGEFSIIKWQGFPEGVPKPTGPFRILAGEEYQVARSTANNANRVLRSGDATLAGKQIHEIQPVKLNGSPTNGTNKVALPPQDHAKVTTWFNRFLRQMKEFLDGK